MKKLLTLALAVLGFTAAQAVTIDWTADKGFNLKEASGDITITLKVTSPTTFDYQTSANGTSVFELGSFSVVKWNNGSTDSPTFSGRFVYPGDNGDEMVVLGGDTSNERLTGTTTYELIFGYDETNKNWNELTVKATWGGQPATTSTLCSGKTIAIDADTFIGLNGYSSDLDFTLTSATISGDGIAAVPEPTVLALLALGVAGVALKRKKVVA